MLLTMDATGIATPQPAPGQVIVVGSEKGGCGKSTTAMHIVVALLRSGARVASIDTDGRQRTLTRYVENRARTARRLGRGFQLPAHFVVAPGSGDRASDGGAFAALADVVDRIGEAFDYIVIDTPPMNSHLTRLSHGMADTLVTPLNDSFVDVDVVGHVDPESLMVERIGPYAELVIEARHRRQAIDGRRLDWVVVRNRLWSLGGRNQQRVAAALERLAGRLGFRVGPGISERLAFRELFPAGLTVLDMLDRKVFGFEPTMSHVAARREIRGLMATLRLPASPGTTIESRELETGAGAPVAAPVA